MRQVINEVFDDKDHYFKNKTDKLLIELVGQKQLNKYSEIIRYLIIGVLTTLVSLLTYYLCVHTFLFGLL